METENSRPGGYLLWAAGRRPGMSLIEISITNYKSIGSCIFQLNGVTALLGENGTGKSNILSAVRYFYDNLISRSESDEIFDHNNRLNNRVEIALTYDLSRLKRYARANLKDEKTRYASYYEKIVGISAEDIITVRMVKIRDMPVRWSHNADTRKLIAGLFPMYFVDARQIDLVNWDVLWKHIGDLMKLENNVGRDLREELRKSIGDASGQMKERLEQIERGFERQNVKVAQYSKNEFAAALSKMYFSGDQYQFDDSRLSEFSNGTNAYNFTYLLLSILRLMAETKMKEPLIILDEPEISLHNNMIDNLAEVFYQCRGYVGVLLATHSARLVKNILAQEGGDNQLYQVYRRGEETRLSRFQMFRKDTEMRERYFITDQHASAYFAKALFLVEGETELEVFRNRFLRGIFPRLSQIELIKGMSDDVVYRIVSPKNRGCHIPVTILLDLDKVYTYPEKLKKKYFHMCSAGENYFFYKRKDTPSSSRASLAARRNRIYNMAAKCRFHYVRPFYLSEDENYQEFIRLIQEYFREYGIFIARTTIEGMLVTEKKLPLFLEFLKEYFSGRYQRIYPFDKRLLKKEEELTFVRLLLGGECDYGMRYNWIRNNSSAMDERLKKLLEENMISKTSWAADWLRFYLCRQAGLKGFGPEEIGRFLREVEKKEKLESVRKAFEQDFPELGELIHMVCQMV